MACRILFIHLPFAFGLVAVWSCLNECNAQVTPPSTANLQDNWVAFTGAAANISAEFRNTSHSDGNQSGGAVVEDSQISAGGGHGDISHHDGKFHGITLAEFDPSHVAVPLLIVVFLFFVCVAKLIFHAWDMTKYVPESCLLILIGCITGFILITVNLQESTLFFIHSRTDVFFLYVLPPIILEASYSLHDREFAENIGSILLFAIFGTLAATFMTGTGLWLLASGCGDGNQMCMMGYGLGQLDYFDMMTFGAVISAVDPVAVLAIFSELGVNRSLYMLVFGESLLNDAVTIVLYKIFHAFSQYPSYGVEVKPWDMFMGFLSFFTVALGGALIGLVGGIITALMTRRTEHCRVVEPLIFFVMAFGSYIIAEVFHWSGIIAVITCGIAQWHYAVGNISFKSRATVKYFSKMAAAATESIIFLVLGIVLVEEPVWQTGFVLWSILIVISARFLWIFALTTYINWTQTVRFISIAERFIMAYGGLRGAIAFALVITLDQRSIEKSKLFTTTTISIVMFTVFLQGLSMKPLMKFLGIRRVQANTRLFNRINSHLFDHCASGVEEIIGRHGRNYWRELFSTIDDKFIKPCLQNDPHSHDEAFIQSWTKLNLNEHYTMLRGDKDKYSYCHGKSSVAGGSVSTLTPSPSMASIMRTPSKVSLKDMGGASATSGGLLTVRQPHQHHFNRRHNHLHHNMQSSSSSNVMSMVGQGGDGCVVTTVPPGSGVSDKMRRISSGSSLQRSDGDVEGGGRPVIVEISGPKLSAKEREQLDECRAEGGGGMSITDDVASMCQRLCCCPIQSLCCCGARDGTSPISVRQRRKSSSGHKDLPKNYSLSELVGHSLELAALNAPHRVINQKYNKNLVHDDEQDLEHHLRRRRWKAYTKAQKARAAATHGGGGGQQSRRRGLGDALYRSSAWLGGSVASALNYLPSFSTQATSAGMQRQESHSKDHHRHQHLQTSMSHGANHHHHHHPHHSAHQQSLQPGATVGRLHSMNETYQENNNNNSKKADDAVRKVLWSAGENEDENDMDEGGDSLAAAAKNAHADVSRRSSANSQQFHSAEQILLLIDEDDEHNAGGKFNSRHFSIIAEESPNEAADAASAAASSGPKSPSPPPPPSASPTGSEHALLMGGKPKITVYRDYNNNTSADAKIPPSGSGGNLIEMTNLRSSGPPQTLSPAGAQLMPVPEVTVTTPGAHNHRILPFVLHADAAQQQQRETSPATDSSTSSTLSSSSPSTSQAQSAAGVSHKSVKFSIADGSDDEDEAKVQHTTKKPSEK